MSEIEANETGFTINYCKEKPVGMLSGDFHSGHVKMDANSRFSDLRQEIEGGLPHDFPPYSRLLLYRVIQPLKIVDVEGDRTLDLTPNNTNLLVGCLDANFISDSLPNPAPHDMHIVFTTKPFLTSSGFANSVVPSFNTYQPFTNPLPPSVILGPSRHFGQVAASPSHRPSTSMSLPSNISQIKETRRRSSRLSSSIPSQLANQYSFGPDDPDISEKHREEDGDFDPHSSPQKRASSRSSHSIKRSTDTFAFPNGGACILTNGHEATDVAHIIPFSGFEALYCWCEKAWKIHGFKLNQNSRGNIIPLAKTHHWTYDKGLWVLLPDKAVLDWILAGRGVSYGTANTTQREFNVFDVNLPPSYSICRLTVEEPAELQTFVHPFEDFPKLLLGKVHPFHTILKTYMLVSSILKQDRKHASYFTPRFGMSWIVVNEIVKMWIETAGEIPRINPGGGSGHGSNGGSHKENHGSTNDPSTPSPKRRNRPSSQDEEDGKNSPKGKRRKANSTHDSEHRSEWETYRSGSSEDISDSPDLPEITTDVCPPDIGKWSQMVFWEMHSVPQTEGF